MKKLMIVIFIISILLSACEPFDSWLNGALGETPTATVNPTPVVANPTPAPVNPTPPAVVNPTPKAPQPTAQAPAQPTRTTSTTDPAFLATQVVSASSTNLPNWKAVYGDASRTGVEEGDIYAFYPKTLYLVVASDFNGILGEKKDSNCTSNCERWGAVHMIYVAASTEQHLNVEDGEVIPAMQGELASNVYLDGISLTAFKAAVKGIDSLPFYTGTVNSGGVITPGISR